MTKPVVRFSIVFQSLGWILLFIFILIIWNYQLCSHVTHFYNNDNDCQQSLNESDGFICESNYLWNKRKYIYQTQEKKNLIRRPNSYYFASNWEPNFHCSHAERIGAMGDGGKWICDLFRMKSQNNCLIYSAGSSGDFSFEIHMKKVLPHCEIHTFDKNLYLCPTNTCIFHQIMFGTDIQLNNSETWSTIIQKLSHRHRFIDVLKIDIEGGEYSFLPQIFNSIKNIWPRQILVELHPINVTIIEGIFDLMRKNNYVIFNKENNVDGGPYFFEYGFLKLNPQFFLHSSSKT
ncbi:unnamed protein product [Adineta steineri]|uniref:Methyltransferase domain-containing protein n=1 Tax=Adineta steineri TaxID=433720 RepID=A0A813MK29_9BILA|nr:unnamed protein product [Adineta steineri]CAF4164298.1 unnamed protein product [Adineta steineri]